MNHSTSGTREGFQVMRDRPTLPKDSSALDQKTKQALAICHLFLNRNMAIADIVRSLGEDTGSVVLALLEQEIIRDRRNNPCGVPAEKERRKSIANPRTDGR